MATENNNLEHPGTKNKTAMITRQETDSTSGRKLIMFILLIVALLALVFSIVNYLHMKDTVTHDAIDQLDNKLGSFNDAIELFSARHNEIDARIIELSGRQQQTAKVLMELYEQQPGDNIEWAVAEIEHLIVIAIHRLVLERDIKNALAAMQAAENRLSAIGDPALDAARSQLAADIYTLESAEIQDISDLSLSLTDLITRADTLPLQSTPFINKRAETEETEVESPIWKKLLSGVWAEIKSMFVIVRTGMSVKARLLPDESYFLVQNLRLQLETARFALFRRDTRSFQASIELVIEWLKEYFNMADRDVKNIIETLEIMKGIDLEPQLPNLNSSLETIRSYIKDQMEAKLPGSGTDLR